MSLLPGVLFVWSHHTHELLLSCCVSGWKKTPIAAVFRERSARDESEKLADGDGVKENKLSLLLLQRDLNGSILKHIEHKCKCN